MRQNPLMATLDIVILTVLGFGLLRGMRSGFLKQATALFGTILALVLAASFMDSAGQLALSLGRLSKEQAVLIGFMGVFILVKMAVNMLSAVLASALEKIKLSGLDRLAGGVTGVLKAAIAMSLIFIVIGYAQLPGEVSREQSKLYQPVYDIVPVAWSLFESRSTGFGDLLRSVEDRLDPRGYKLPI